MAVREMMEEIDLKADIFHRFLKSKLESAEDPRLGYSCYEKENRRELIRNAVSTFVDAMLAVMDPKEAVDFSDDIGDHVRDMMNEVNESGAGHLSNLKINMCLADAAYAMELLFLHRTFVVEG